MRRTTWTRTLVVAALLGAGATTHAAPPPADSAAQAPGSISGVVKDSQTGEPVKDAIVILQCSNPTKTAEMQTNARGIYRFTNVPAAQCTVQVLHGKADVSKVVKLPRGAKFRANFKINPKNDFRRTVTVQTESLSVNRIDMEQAKNLPVGRSTSRDFTTVVNVSPTAARDSYSGATFIQDEASNREGYAHTPENDIHRAKNRPLSTFSIDVDTASYSNARRFLQGGSLPPPSAVRVEEMINYFTYDATPPTDPKKPFGVLAEVGPNPWNPKKRLVRLTLKAREIPRDRVPPRNLVFLLDVSGSMQSPDKLPLLQHAMEMLVDTLRPEDRVAIVVYAGSAGVVLHPTAGDDKSTIRNAIGRLSAGGSTNGAGGIRKAYALAREHFAKEGINRVILGTDGDFNVGVSSDGELVKLIERERKSGVFLTVLGFGTGNLQDAKMESLADHGNGNYAYIDTPNEAERVLVQEAAGTLVTVAKDVKIQVEFNPARVEDYRLIGYENRKLAARDFDDDLKDAGEIGAGHSVTALYEVTLAKNSKKDQKKRDRAAKRKLRYQKDREPTKAAATDELLLVKIRHKQPQGRKSRLQQFAIRDHGRRMDQTSRDFRFAAAVAGFGLLLRESKHAGNLSWDMVDRLARGARGKDPHGQRAEFLDLVEAARRQRD